MSGRVFLGVSSTNFLISSGSMANLLAFLYILEAIMSIRDLDVSSYFSPLAPYCQGQVVEYDWNDVIPDAFFSDTVSNDGTISKKKICVRCFGST